jgi:hypothetical protein
MKALRDKRHSASRPSPIAARSRRRCSAGMAIRCGSSALEMAAAKPATYLASN